MSSAEHEGYLARLLIDCNRAIPSDEFAAMRRRKLRGATTAAALLSSGCSLATVTLLFASLWNIAGETLPVYALSASAVFWIAHVTFCIMGFGYLPLAESEQCEAALMLSRASNWAEQVRSAALAAGRQLYMRDYQLMQEASSVEKGYLERERRRNACLELHHVAGD